MTELINCDYDGCTGYDESQPFNCHHGCKDPGACDSYLWWQREQSKKYTEAFNEELLATESDIVDSYATLSAVLNDALEEASSVKGKERHATDNAFSAQIICTVPRMLKGHPFAAQAYQIIKKTIEAGRLYTLKGPDAAYKEMLGVINYASAMNILIKE